MQTHMCFDRCVQVLLDTFAIENMPAFRLDGVLRDIIAQATNRGLPFFAEHASVVLAANYEIGMARHLTHARYQGKDVGVVYKCSSVNQH